MNILKASSVRVFQKFTVHGESENVVLNLFTCIIPFAKLVIFRESDLKKASLIILSD